MSVRVLLVDDHPIVRDGIRQILTHNSEIEVVAETGRGEQALPLAREHRPDVVLLDMDLPDINGLEVARRFKASDLHTQILVISAYQDFAFIQGVLEEGVSGYLVKDEAPEIIVSAVLGVASGQKGWFSRQVAAQLAAHVQAKKPNERRFTRREMQVLRLIVQGKTNQFIAAEMGVSEKTIEKYVETIYRKLGTHSRVETAVAAVREKLAE